MSLIADEGIRGSRTKRIDGKATVLCRKATGVVLFQTRRWSHSTPTPLFSKPRPQQTDLSSSSMPFSQFHGYTWSLRNTFRPVSMRAATATANHLSILGPYKPTQRLHVCPAAPPAWSRLFAVTICSCRRFSVFRTFVKIITAPVSLLFFPTMRVVIKFALSQKR